MNKLTKEISKKSEGIKLSNYLMYELKFSTRLRRKLIKQNAILVNGNIEKNYYILKAGDVVEIKLDADETQDIAPEDIPVDVVFEDEDLVIVDKPPFMVVHPTKSHQEGTLANGVMNYFKKTGQKCIIRLVNRLDRDTSGLIIIAKSQFAHQAMAKKLNSNEIEKYYIAVVEGFMEGSGTIDLPIDREYPDSIKRTVMENGQRAITHYKVLSPGNDMSVVVIRLETGRTHQIRVHFSHLGHPIIGDALYGKESTLIKRQALHAYMLRFNSIRENRQITIKTKIPDDMKVFLENIKEININPEDFK